MKKYQKPDISVDKVDLLAQMSSMFVAIHEHKTKMVKKSILERFLDGTSIEQQFDMADL